MKIAMIGLGKMGANMTQRLLQGGHAEAPFFFELLAAMRQQFGGHAVKKVGE